MLADQRASFRKLLNYVWQHSSFYREFYSSHGIKEKDLPDVTVRDLPFLTKELLMENFDAAVTDSRIRKMELEQWIQENPDPGRNFLNDFIVIHSSGSSGHVGIFVYDRTAWQIASYTLATYLPPLENTPLGKTRVAFYLASHGHFASVSTAVRMPAGIYDPLIFSVLEAPEKIVKRLNNFQPDQLGGYSSSVSLLAEFELQGRLRIHPRRIFVSGDKLTASMERTIQDAWRVPVWVLYSTSESSCLALRHSGQEEMVIVEDLNLVEVLNEANQAVLPDAEGRVVVTNLYNYTLPILRYELGDYVVLGHRQSDSNYRTIRDIKGRASDSLPVILEDGTRATISHSGGAFFVPGVEKVQFISRRPDHVELQYVGTQDLDTSVRKEFQRILKMKGASRTTFEVRRVAHIANDSKTGKFRRVIKLEGATYQSFGVLSVPSTPERPAAIDHELMDSFIEFNKEEIEHPVVDRFELQVAKYADRVAVKTTDQVFTYDALNQTANRVARAILARCGDGHECVALLFEQGVALIAAMLGALKAGKIEVMLDPSNPLARMNFILRDSRATLMITDSQNISLARQMAQNEFHLLNIDEMDGRFTAENLNRPMRADASCRIIYTSGSTGEPKGVVLSHRRILHEIMSNTNGCRICAGDRVALLTSPSTGQGMVATYAALLNGATLCHFNLSEEGLNSLAVWLNTEQITIYISVPTVFRRLGTTLAEGQEFPHVRVIRLGADQVRKSDVKLYKRHFPKGLLKIFLSTTEAGNLCQYSIHRETEIATDIVPVGYAVDGMEIMLLDNKGEDLGYNQIGEIAVRSRYLALGYWRRPDLTEGKFLPDPEGGDKRIYLTGDLGRRRSDGRFEYLGRIDSRVKIRGYTVETVEIESVLGQHPAVRETVVLTPEDASGELRLVAYVVPKQESTLTISELRKFLNKKLPGYMIPSVFVFLESMPLTPNGKVDRRALPLPDAARPELESNFAAPRTAVERRLADIWAEVLNLEKVGVHDNFFDLGGHSLAATRLISRVIQEFHLELPIKALFEAPSVAAMSATIMQSQASKAGRDDLERILSELEAMSDEEAERVLKNLTGKVEQ